MRSDHIVTVTTNAVTEMNAAVSFRNPGIGGSRLDAGYYVLVLFCVNTCEAVGANCGFND
jgi:hypothetical protein